MEFFDWCKKNGLQVKMTYNPEIDKFTAGFQNATVCYGMATIPVQDVSGDSLDEAIKNLIRLLAPRTLHLVHQPTGREVHVLDRLTFFGVPGLQVHELPAKAECSMTTQKRFIRNRMGQMVELGPNQRRRERQSGYYN